MSFSTSRCGIVLVGLFLFATLAQAQNEKKRVPDRKAVEQAISDIKDFQFKDLYAEAEKDPKARGTLAVALTNQVNKPENRKDVALYYAYLKLARKESAKAGLIGLAVDALQKTDAAFQIEAKPLILETFETAAKAMIEPAQSMELAAMAEKFCRGFLAEADYAGAKRLSKLAFDAAQKNRKDLAGFRRMRAFHQMVEAVAQAEKTLHENPDNADACTAMGQFQVLFFDNWKLALPLLAKCSDATWKKLALMEKQRPTDFKTMNDVAAGWYELSKDKALGKPAKDVLVKRSLAWYFYAFPKVRNNAIRQYLQKQIHTLSDECGYWQKKALEDSSGANPDILSPDTRWLISIASGRLWDFASKKLVHTFRHKLSPSRQALAFSAGSQLFASSAFNVGDVIVWNLQNAKEQYRLKGYSRYSKFSPDGSRLATSFSTDRKMIKFWDAKTGKLDSTLTCPGNVADFYFSPDGRRLMTYTVTYTNNRRSSKTLTLWDVTPTRFTKRFTFDVSAVDPKGWYVSRARFSPNSRWFAALLGFESNAGHKTILFDLATGKVRYNKSGPSGALRFSPDSKRLVVGGWTGGAARARTGYHLHLYDLDKAAIEPVEHKPDGKAPSHFEFSPDGKWLISTHTNDGQSYLVFSTFPDFKPQFKLNSPFTEDFSSASFLLSPDRRWVIGNNRKGPIEFMPLMPPDPLEDWVEAKSGSSTKKSAE